MLSRVSIAGVCSVDALRMWADKKSPLQLREGHLEKQIRMLEAKKNSQRNACDMPWLSSTDTELLAQLELDLDQVKRDIAYQKKQIKDLPDLKGVENRNEETQKKVLRMSILRFSTGGDYKFHGSETVEELELILAQKEGVYFGNGYLFASEGLGKDKNTELWRNMRADSHNFEENFWNEVDGKDFTGDKANFLKMMKEAYKDWEKREASNERHTKALKELQSVIKQQFAEFALQGNPPGEGFKYIRSLFRGDSCCSYDCMKALQRRKGQETNSEVDRSNIYVQVNKDNKDSGVLSLEVVRPEDIILDKELRVLEFRFFDRDFRLKFSNAARSGVCYKLREEVEKEKNLCREDAEKKVENNKLLKEVNKVFEDYFMLLSKWTPAMHNGSRKVQQSKPVKQLQPLVEDTIVSQKQQKEEEKKQDEDCPAKPKQDAKELLSRPDRYHSEIESILADTDTLSVQDMFKAWNEARKLFKAWKDAWKADANKDHFHGEKKMLKSTMRRLETMRRELKEQKKQEEQRIKKEKLRQEKEEKERLEKERLEKEKKERLVEKAKLRQEELRQKKELEVKEVVSNEDIESLLKKVLEKSGQNDFRNHWAAFSNEDFAEILRKFLEKHEKPSQDKKENITEQLQTKKNLVDKIQKILKKHDGTKLKTYLYEVTSKVSNFKSNVASKSLQELWDLEAEVNEAVKEAEEKFQAEQYRSGGRVYA